MASFERIIESKTFRFLIGPQREEYNLHSALISKHSRPLGVLVNGQMKEALEGCALLEDVDKHTFVRFCEYMYTGNYQPAEYTLLLDESSVLCGDEEEPKKSSGSNRGEDGPPAETLPPAALSIRASHRPTIDDDDDWGHFCAKSRKKGAKAIEVEPPASKRTLLWQKFSQQRFDAQITHFEPRKNAEACEDYTEVFLSHAQLYVFAEKYDVQELRYVALQKLQRTLAEFSLYEERAGDISTLLRYVYEHTAEHKNKPDNLRSLIVHYVSCNIEILAKDESFRNLLKEGGSIAGDLVDRLIERLD